eukprot:2404347-Pyramimonas_sp.AAC.1
MEPRGTDVGVVDGPFRQTSALPPDSPGDGAACQQLGALAQACVDDERSGLQLIPCQLRRHRHRLPLGGPLLVHRFELEDGALRAP